MSFSSDTLFLLSATGFGLALGSLLQGFWRRHRAIKAQSSAWSHSRKLSRRYHKSPVRYLRWGIRLALIFAGATLVLLLSWSISNASLPVYQQYLGFPLVFWLGIGCLAAFSPLWLGSSLGLATVVVLLAFQLFPQPAPASRIRSYAIHPVYLLFSQSPWQSPADADTRPGPLAEWCTTIVANLPGNRQL